MSGLGGLNKSKEGVQITDGTSCGFPRSDRSYGGAHRG